MTSICPADPPPSDVTRDGFLGGRLTILQPKEGYRAGIDAVLLAASVRARPGQSVLDLGCGVGVAALCLGWRVQGLRLCGLEMQVRYAALARKNAEKNGIAFEVHDGDLSKMPAALRQQSFDHVVANPPYYRVGARSPSRDPGRETAHGERTPLAVWIDAATRRLAPRGTLSVIQRADRLPDLLAALDSRLGSVQVLPIQPRTAQPAGLILLTARKSGKGGFELRSPLILHEGLRHEKDAESYRESVRAVLRDGALLN